METQVRQLVNEFNETKNPELYKRILDIHSKDRCKCIVCGQDIIYPQTKISINKNGIPYPLNACYTTEKIVNGKSYSLKVCKNCLENKYEIKNYSRTFNVLSESTKYAFQISEEDSKEFKKGYALTLEHMINKYGEEEGKKKWDEYCKKQSETNTFEYKKEKYGWTEEQFKDFNKSRACTLKNFVDRYGEEEGKKKWNEYCKKQSETKSWDYMVKTHGEEWAKNVLLKKAVKCNNFYSKVSQEVFKELDKYFCPKYTTQYATKDGEHLINYKHLAYSLDYYVKELNIAIEFNGTIYHADPRRYTKDSKPNPFYRELTAEEIWKKEKFRIKLLKDIFNIKVYTIWELDYKNLNYKDFVEKIIRENTNE